jgi:hypothetical protein
MKRQRKHYTPEEKDAILRRHLPEKEPISRLCAEAVLRERDGCLRAEGAAEPLRRPGVNRPPGEEDPDQGRGPGRTDGRASDPRKNVGGTLTGAWVPHDTPSGAGRRRLRSTPGASRRCTRNVTASWRRGFGESRQVLSTHPTRAPVVDARGRTSLRSCRRIRTRMSEH